MKTMNKMIFALALITPMGLASATTNTSTAAGTNSNTSGTQTGTMDQTNGTTSAPGVGSTVGTPINNRPATSTNPTTTSPGRTTTGTGANMRSSAFDNLSTDIIMSAQEALSNRGYDVRADGVTGTQTRRAVSRFQSENGIPQTGVLDEPTLNALSVPMEDTDRSPASTPTHY